VLVPSGRSSAGRLPFLIVVGAVLVVGLVAVLMLHMLAAQDAFRANNLQQRLALLTDQQQQVASAVEADSSPQTLRERAAALGMVPATVTGLHRLRDGRAVGQQTPVYTPPPAPPATTTTTTKAKGAAKSAGAKAAGNNAAGNNAAGPAAKFGSSKAGAGSPQHHKHHSATSP
jgi:type II secretory pathway pseudopilin PulG